jgi:single stranded DNA-binding protein
VRIGHGFAKVTYRRNRPTDRATTEARARAAEQFRYQSGALDADLGAPNSLLRSSELPWPASTKPSSSDTSGRDPELRYLQSGQPVCKLNIATSRRYTNKQNESVEETEWHRVSVWGKQAEHCNNFLTKGRQVYVEGRLRTSSYDKDGQKHYTTEIVADTVQFIGGRGEGGGGDAERRCRGRRPSQLRRRRRRRWWRRWRRRRRQRCQLRGAPARRRRQPRAAARPARSARLAAAAATTRAAAAVPDPSPTSTTSAATRATTTSRSDPEHTVRAPDGLACTRSEAISMRPIHRVYRAYTPGFARLRRVGPARAGCHAAPVCCCLRADPHRTGA